ncbi:unnamed protein product [Ranitomeya imitator]|uniref:Midasin AAA lid domain-containing protein n=1 Tax=Ranitomeya imitator TaxID=111125 RepID=A0ABN9M239_9NEOB|nr:unnamed protein product [Ranitomeya imitator]
MQNWLEFEIGRHVAFGSRREPLTCLNTVGNPPQVTPFLERRPPKELIKIVMVLSRAFRKRFVELHYDELPSAELETILHKRCCLPPSYCNKLVAVMLELQSHRRGSSVFAGKHGFITLRDLFRWAERYRLSEQTEKDYDWLQHLANDGTAACVYEEINGAGDQLDLTNLSVHLGFLLLAGRIVAKPPFANCLQLCKIRSFTLLTVINTWKTSDFLGGLRPVRHKSKDKDEDDDDSSKLFEWHDGPLVLAMVEDGFFLLDEIFTCR